MQSTRHAVRSGAAAALLRLSGQIWFICALIGQAAFIYFILAYYGSRTLQGDYAAWDEKPIIEGYTEGDGFGNVMFALHVLLAAVITFGGLMQLVPPLRRRLPVLHRWTGRVFMLLAVFMAVGGLWLTWGRGSYLSVPSALAVSGNAVAILVIAPIALGLALRRRFEGHRRWAMRLFMVVNGVWFFRVGVMAWIILNQGPVGMNRTISGPADLGLAYGSYLIPLAVLEVYFWAQRSRAPFPKLLAVALVLVATGITALGTFGTVTRMWGPYL